jgi:hypothetical protein
MTIIFRGYKLETRKRAHDWVARVTDPEGGQSLFTGKGQMEVEQQARDFIKQRHPWRDADEEEPETEEVS